MAQTLAVVVDADIQRDAPLTSAAVGSVVDDDIHEQGTSLHQVERTY